MQDEARHVAFGRLALRDYYPELTDAERREREDFVIEGSYHLRDRFNSPEMWERLGFDVKEVVKMLDESEGQVRFRKRLFSRIVPTVRDIGLWSERVQKAYTDLGGIQYADTDAQEMLDNDAKVAEEFDRRMKEGFAADSTSDRHHPAHHHLAAGDGHGARLHHRRPQLAHQPRAGAVPRLDRRVDRHRLADRLSAPLRRHLRLVGRRVRDSRGAGLLLRLRMDPARAPHGAGARA